MSLSSGTRLGSYEVVRALGSGGMAEVYQARDLKLDRDVALKVMRESDAADRERLHRFELEAKSASNLNHPNIVHIYDIDTSGPQVYIAMELVTGRTLRSILDLGALSLRQILDVTLQLARGMAKAHSENIVHRDLKPENIILSDDGFLKILDFGLAKLRTDVDETQLQTRTGAILGTAGYMAPEQARGGAVDYRADQFNFGLILYEMVTGRRAFRKASIPQTLAAIITSEPEPILSLNPDAPPPLIWIVDRCLRKRPTERYSSSHDLVKEIDNLRQHMTEISSGNLSVGSGPTMVAGTESRRRSAIWIGGLVLVAAVFAFWMYDTSTERIGGALAAGRLRQLVTSRTPADNPDLAPDGKMFAYIAQREGQVDLFVRRVAGGKTISLTNNPEAEASPDYSPDGELIAFARYSEESDPEIFVVPALGGQERRVVTGGSMPEWSPDGSRIAFVQRPRGEQSSLATIAADGTGLRQILAADGNYPFIYDPAWSPDGQWLAVRRSNGGVHGEIWRVPVAGGDPERLTTNEGGVYSVEPVFTVDGRGIVYASNRSGSTNLWYQSLADGEVVRLTSGAGPDLSPSVAESGEIAYLNSRWRYSIEEFTFATGETRLLVSHSYLLWNPAISPDGQQLVFGRAEVDGSWHVWIKSGDSAPRQLTTGEGNEIYPSFTPEGDSVVFFTWGRPRQILSVSISTGVVAELTDGIHDDGYGEVSPDGRLLVFARIEDGVERVFVKDLLDGREQRLTDSPSSLPHWSRDGDKILFAHDRSMDNGISIMDADGSNERRLSHSGGWPGWWPNGKKVSFLRRTSDGRQVVMAVNVEGGEPEVVDSMRFSGDNHPFVVSADELRLIAGNSEHLGDEIWLVQPP